MDQSEYNSYKTAMMYREELRNLKSLNDDKGRRGRIADEENEEEEHEPEPIADEVQEELLKARETFMCSRWVGSMKEVMTTGSVKDLEEEPSESSEHLAKVFEKAESDIQTLVDSYLKEDARHSAAHAELLKKKAGVEEMLQALEEAQSRLARELARPEVNEGEAEEEEVDESEEKEGEGQYRLGLKELRAKQEQKEMLDQRVVRLEEKLADMKTKEMDQDQYSGEEKEGGISSAEEKRLRTEMAKLQKHGDWVEALSQTLQDLYSMQVQVSEAIEDTNNGGSRTVVMQMTYPTQHALVLKLATFPQIRILDAKLQSPPSIRKPENLNLSPMLQASSSLAPPDDIMFLVREVGWMLGSREVAKQDIKSLMSRFIVKSSESMEEFVVTITFAEGVVASFSLLPGYPQMPGSLRITSLVGVGGWRDSELAITSRSLNRLALDSLPALVDTLHQRISDLDSKA